MRFIRYLSVFILGILLFSILPLFHQVFAEDALSAIHGISNNDIWAVGTSQDEQGKSLIEHYDGMNWHVMSSPNPGINGTSLESVTALSSVNAWAVGTYVTAEGSQTLIDHFDGTNWTVVSSPNPPEALNSDLNNISAISANDIWAVGNYQDANYIEHTLTEHYDGAHWSIIDSGAENDEGLVSATAVSTNNVWAVGYNDNDGRSTLIKHWNGTDWTTVSSPNHTQSSSNFLNGITYISPTNIWAVGNYIDATGAPSDPQGEYGHALLLHYDGTHWTIIDDPLENMPSRDALYSISASAENNIWAVGTDSQRSDNSLILHYDGTQWTISSNPDINQVKNITGTNVLLLGVNTFSSSDIWTSGVSYKSDSSLTQRGIFEHWDGNTWDLIDSAYRPGSNITPLIFIPGIMGSKLSIIGSSPISPIQKEKEDNGRCVPDEGQYDYLKGDLIWINESINADNYVRVGPSCSNYLDVLQFNSDGRPLYPQIGLNSDVTDSPYNNITIPYLEQHGYTKNQNLFVFTYDWRKDIDESEIQLEASISSILNQTGAQKVDIMAHSMGGLLARDYISEPSRAANVDKLVELGTPHEGSPKFLSLLLYNACPLKILWGTVCVVNGQETNKLLQNFPGAFELLPSKKYYTDLYTNQANYPFSDDRDIDNNGVTGPLNYQQLHTLLQNKNKNMHVFDIAERFHDALDTTYQNTNGVLTYLIAGSGQATIGQIHDYSGINILNQTRTGLLKKISQDADVVNGDGTVPLESATLVHLTNVFYTNQEHGDLPTGPGLEMALNLIEGNSTLPSGVDVIPTKYNGKIIGVYSPAQIDVYDDQNNHTGIAADGSIEENIPGSSYDVVGEAKFISLPNDGHYHVTTQQTAEGSFDLKVKDFTNSQLTKEQLYLGVPQQASTEATMNLDETDPVLHLDNNGDGTTDQNIQASSISGDALLDTQSPVSTASATGILGNDGAYVSAVTVTINANDNNSGVLKTEYSLDNGATINTYTAPFTITTDGITKVLYRSIDKAGNVEDQKELDVTNESPKIVATATKDAVIVGKPFTVLMKVINGKEPFNAAQASISASQNLSIIGLQTPTSDSCNFQYTKTPTKTDLSFAGAIFGSSANTCTVYTLTVVPQSAGTGVITITSNSIKSYNDNIELATSPQNTEIIINQNEPTPTPTIPLPPITIGYPSQTYLSSLMLTGTKDSAITHIFVNGTDNQITYPTDTTWQHMVTLSLGNNTFTLYGKDDVGNQTSTQTAVIDRHTLGDINGDGNVDLIDASLFAVDWDKNSDLAYILSDINDSGNVDLTDLSILAKLEQ